MKKNEFYFKSCDGVTRIHAAEWIPDGEAVAVLQICHGMTEHIMRYGEFAEYLADRGFYVTGHDHLGHGKSVQDEDCYGYFHETKGNRCVIGDIHKLRWRTERRYPDVPYFMLGHSMGSFLLRQYLMGHSEGLSGAIIMGTGYHGKAELTLGRALCRAVAAARGWRHRSEIINAIGFGGFNRRFSPCETEKDWLTTDTEKRDAYIRDPYCNFTFTVNGYYHMFGGMRYLEKRENIEKIRKDLPLLFTSGQDDPVGGFGKGVKRVYDRYVDAGIENVEMRLYEGDRHEILNERDRDRIYEDCYMWMRENI